MKLSELVKKADLKEINEYRDRNIEGVYISDMVSDILTNAKAGVLLVTLQTHKTLIATANLVDVAAIIFVKGKNPPNDVVELANKAGIPLLVSEADTWTMAGKLISLGIK